MGTSKGVDAMKITINGKGMEISTYLEDVVHTRVGKLDKYLNDDTNVQVVLSMFRGRQVAELTVQVGTVVLRSEEATGDMYASVDNACKKLERQIIRYRTRMDKRIHASALKHEPLREETNGDAPQADAEETWPQVVRTKRFAIKPMGVEEAIMQMEMLGHTFFVFSNAEDGQVNVIYKRNDGNIGLIEPEIG